MIHASGWKTNLILVASTFSNLSSVATSQSPLKLRRMSTVTGIFLEFCNSISHVALAQRADLVLIAPATAHSIAKIVNGMADDFLTTTVLASKAPVVIAPAMDGYMFENPATQDNLQKLKDRGIFVLGPGEGRLASGLTGFGRLVEVPYIVDAVASILGLRGDLQGRLLVVSAGGTQEPIDPVRMITNRSSGKMGFAIARAARDRGADVTLVSAPTSLQPIFGVKMRQVTTVSEMRTEVLDSCSNADVLIMAAAVSDYRPKKVFSEKIKKDSSDTDISIEFSKNDDFLLEVPIGVLKVGFAAESQHLIVNAKKKLVDKGLALIAANDITSKDSGFNVDDNRVTILDQSGNLEEIPLMNKYDVAHRILDKVVKLLE